MKNFTKALILSLFLASAGFAAPALAATPVLSANFQSSNTITITVNNANPNSFISLYLKQSSSLWSQISNIGQTNYSGYFSQLMNITTDGSANPVQMYVVVGGLQSPAISVYPYGNNNCSGYGCSNCGYYNNCNSTYLTFSNSNPSLNVGQSLAVTIYPATNYQYNYNSYYISSNSNNSAVSASLSGQTLNLYANNSGSSSIVVCQSGGSACGTINVTVNGSNNYGNLTLSQSVLNLTYPQSSTVSIFSNNYYGGSYYISSNSNPNVASASINGSSLYVTAQNFSGSTNISVCQNSNYNSCATLAVNVNGGGNNCYYYNNCNNGLSLSQTNVFLNVGQSSLVSVYNNAGGSLYISNNSNSSVVSATISGNNVNLLGYNNGSSNVIVCSNGNNSQCGTIYITVGGNNYNNLSFTQSSVSMQVSQSTNVGIIGSGSYYVSNNSNPGVVNASISGSTLYLNSVAVGNSNITVCQSVGNSQCATLNVSVYGNGSNSGSIWFSQNSVTLNASQNTSVTIYSNNYGGNYYVSSNSPSGVVSASVVGNTLNLTGIGTGSANVTVCQANGSAGCGILYVSVNGGSCNYYNCNNNTILSLSQTSLSLSNGQSATVNIYGSGSYYISSNSNNSVASTSLNGSVLTVYAGQTGSTTISVCQSSYSSCVSLYVTVGGGNVLGASTYANGTLVSINGTVYIVYKNTITGFSSAGVFLGLGFSFSNVIPANTTSGLYNSGYIVSTAAASHPWGSWIKSGGTIYFVDQSGLIPVPNWDIFLNNGGQANLVVPANYYDFQRTILSPMTYNDSRLH